MNTGKRTDSFLFTLVMVSLFATGHVWQGTAYAVILFFSHYCELRAAVVRAYGKVRRQP